MEKNKMEAIKILIEEGANKQKKGWWRRPLRLVWKPNGPPASVDAVSECLPLQAQEVRPYGHCIVEPMVAMVRLSCPRDLLNLVYGLTPAGLRAFDDCYVTFRGSPWGRTIWVCWLCCLRPPPVGNAYGSWFAYRRSLLAASWELVYLINVSERLLYYMLECPRFEWCRQES
jgi:hypothetical protein